MRRLTRPLAWGSVALTVGAIPIVRLVVSQPHPGRLGMEGQEGTPFAFLGLVAFSVVGALIVSRYPNHLIGWIFCLSGLAGGVSAVATAYVELGVAVPGSVPALRLLDAASALTFLVGFFGPTSIGLLLFPDGRLPSSRWRLALLTAIGGLGLQFVASFLGGIALGSWLMGAGIAASVASIFAAVASLALRWQHASADTRQQLKWVAVAGAIVVTQLLGELVLVAFRPELIDRAFFYFSLAYTCVPIAVGVAILRYGLYEIDLIINRAIVYVPLSALLAGVYTGFTALFQRVFVVLTGQRSDAAIVVTVFLLATLFTPARNRLQALVDSRFKDPRDLERTMEALEHDVQTVLSVLNRQRLADRFLSEASDGAGALGAALYMTDDQSGEPRLTRGNWDGFEALTVALRSGERDVGRLALGPRRGGSAYGRHQHDRLQKTADAVAFALVTSAEPASL